MNFSQMGDSIQLGNLVKVTSLGARAMGGYSSMDRLMWSSAGQDRSIKEGDIGLVVIKPIDWRGATGLAYGILFSESIVYVNSELLRTINS